jgi:hypothetical protein
MTFKTKLLFRFISVLFCLGCLTQTNFAQTGSLSPYSRYGIGDIIPEGFTHQMGMGGIGAGLSSSYNINYINPSSYLADSNIIFDFGAKGEIRKLERNSQTATYNSASFSYFALAFPIVKHKIAASFGLLPFSSVGYNITVNEEDKPNIGDVKYIYEGEGGFNKVYFGTGFKIYKNLSAGINGSYIFGTIANVKSVEFPYSTNYFSTRYVNAVTAKGFNFNYGLLYDKFLKNDLKLSVGLTGSLSANLNASNNKYYYNYLYSASADAEILKDSVINEQNTNGKIKLPDYWRGGFTIGKPMKWTLGLDFSYYNWERYKSFDSVDSLKNSYTLNIGGERYGEKFIYRLGGHYGTTYLNLKNTQLNDYGITFGIGINKLFPKRPPSTVNIAFELGQRGTLKNDLIKEQYFKFHIGFTLTDIWFIKPKYD